MELRRKQKEVNGSSIWFHFYRVSGAVQVKKIFNNFHVTFFFEQPNGGKPHNILVT